MVALITVLHIIVCLFLMLTVLLQSGKGGSMGAAFGGGNAATVFGGSGASSFLRRLTAIAATIFMVGSMILAYISSYNSSDPLEKFGQQQSEAAKKKEEAKTNIQSGAADPGAAAPGSPAGTSAVEGSDAPSAGVEGPSATGSAAAGSAPMQPDPDRPEPAPSAKEQASGKAEKTSVTETPEKKIEAEKPSKPDTTPNPGKKDKAEKANKGNQSVEGENQPSDVPESKTPADPSPSAP